LHGTSHPRACRDDSKKAPPLTGGAEGGIAGGFLSSPANE